MHRIEKNIEVNAPLREVYDQWTQFEKFPQFMEGVKSVQQLDDNHLRWRAEVLGQLVGWDAEITEQIPDERIAWRSTSGHPNVGAVFFKTVEGGKTDVTLSLEYQPLGAVESAADALGILSLRVEWDLKRFKKFIEDRLVATGGWRGEIR